MTNVQAFPHPALSGTTHPLGDSSVDRLISLVTDLVGEQKRDIGEISKSIGKMETNIAVLTEQSKSQVQIAEDLKTLGQKCVDHEQRIGRLEADDKRRTGGLQAWMVWAGSAAIAVVGELVKKLLHL